MNSILSTLHTFALQRPRLDPRNYGCGIDGWRAYRRDGAQITRDLHRVRHLVDVASARDLPDVVYLEACRGDRLSLEQTPCGWRVDYTTGQYFPTEYRRAVERILRRALAA